MWEPFKKGIVEEYDTGLIPQTVEYKGKITATWSKMKRL